MHKMEILRQWTRYTMFYLLVTSHFLFLSTYGEMDFVVNQTHQATFDQAERYCLEEGYAGLAVLDTPEKMDVVKNSGEIDKNKDYWVALYQWDRQRHRATTFAWTTGTTWALWKPDSEPNNLQRDHCARYWGQRHELANSHCTDDTYNFICEKSYEIMKISGSYPIMHKDKTLRNDYPQLVLFSGTTRSETECVTNCASSLICGFVVYNKPSRACSTYLRMLQGQLIPANLLPENGNNIREKKIIL